MVLANAPDGCFSTPASKAEKLAKAFMGSSSVDLKVYGDGGPGSGRCKWGGPHHFAGFERDVEAAIMGFIQANSK